MTPEGKRIFVGKFTKNSGQTRWDREKVRGDTLEGGDIRAKSIQAIVSDEQKRSSVFKKKINGVTLQNWQMVMTKSQEK